jgi:membrane protein DedA with SNARE-associated domain
VGGGGGGGGGVRGGGGWWLGRTREEGQTWLHRWLRKPKVAQRVERLRGRFERHGALYLVVNRFLPAFRSLFFIAAGMSGMARGPVLGAALLGGALWNGLLLGAGWAVGYNLEALEGMLRSYSRVAWGVLGVIAAAWVGRWVVARLRGRARQDGDELR